MRKACQLMMKKNEVMLMLGSVLASAALYAAQTAADYEPAAMRGDAAAQCRLAECYDKGLGTEKNPEQAAQWYLKAAMQGNAEAQYRLGLCYYLGKGVEQDNAKAVEWYGKAAQQGYAKAQHGMGN